MSAEFSAMTFDAVCLSLCEITPVPGQLTMYVQGSKLSAFRLPHSQCASMIPIKVSSFESVNQSHHETQDGGRNRSIKVPSCMAVSKVVRHSLLTGQELSNYARGLQGGRVAGW